MTKSTKTSRFPVKAKLQTYDHPDYPGKGKSPMGSYRQGGTFKYMYAVYVNLFHTRSRYFNKQTTRSI